MIKNKINDKKYIGQSININERWKQHVKNSKNEKLKSRYLYSTFNKYGVENFELIILEENILSSKIDEQEKYWIDYYQTFAPNGYNLTKGGEGSLGRIFTEETRNKMSRKSLKWHRNNQEKFKEIIKSRDCSAAFTEEVIKKRVDSWKNNPKNKEKVIENLTNFEKTATTKQKENKYKKAVKTKKDKGYDFYNFSFGKMTNQEKENMYKCISKNNRFSQNILMLDQNDNVVEQFHSIGSAGKYMHEQYGYSKNAKQNVKKVLDKNKIAYGYKWKRK